MRYQPLNDRVLVRPIEEPDLTPGGIVRPDVSKERPVRGKVVATGDGRWLESGKFIPTQLSPGQVVLYGKYAGTEVEFDGIAHLLIREEEVLAIELPDQAPPA